MSYVESFARAMERARASVSYWDHKTLDHLQAAHDAEMRQCSKSEYHRGFEDGQAVTAADQWQLDRERAKAIEDVRKVVPEGYFGSHDMLSNICRAIYSPVFGWTAEAGRDLCDRLIHLLGGDDGTASNDDRTCPIAVQSPSITDDLRDYLDKNGQEYESFGGAEVATIKGGTTPLYEIADRIDEQFNRICSQHESVLQQTIGDTVDEHEQEMAELRADYERATKLQREYGEKVADLQAELRAAKHLHECNQRWCDALLDLIRDAAKDYRLASKVARRLQERAFELRRERDELLDLLRDSAKDYQECQRLLRVFKCHVKDVRRERDDLLDKLQAISVLCEQDDG